MPRQAPSGKRRAFHTSLPVSPVDGQEIFYRFTQTVVPADPKVIVWHLVYDATSGAWLPVGVQDPVHACQPTAEVANAFSANTWGGVSANDPRVTVPRSGDYEIEWGCGQFWINSGTANWYIAQFSTGSEQTPNGTPPTVDICTAAPTGGYTSAMASKKMTLVATNELRQRYYTTVTGNMTRGSAYAKAYPRRITG